MKPRKGTVICMAVIATAAVVVPTTLWAAGRASSGDQGRVNRQSMEWITAPLSTSSQDFQDLGDPNISGDEGITVVNRGPATITFTGDFSGAPVELRAMKNDQVAQPGVATFDPTTGTTTATFTFFAPAGNRVGCRTYAIHWRSANGKTVTLNHGGFAVTYNRDSTTKNGDQIACF